MSEKASSKQAELDDRARAELDRIAGELYALRPDAFADARDQQVRAARSEKHPTLARALAALRRPTQSAWLINLLWRDQRPVVEQFLEIAPGLSRAQARAAADELRSLTIQRRELESALLRRARTLAEQAGVNVNASTEREAQETLAAALAEPEVAAEVRTGRLVKPAEYAGFGTTISVIRPAGPPRPTPAEAAGPAHPGPEDQQPSRPKPDTIQELAARRARDRRAAAERAAENARAALDDAAGALAEASRVARTAEQRQRELRARVDELDAQLRVVRDEAAQAERAAAVATRQQTQSAQVHEGALRAAERAQQQLNEVG